MLDDLLANLSARTGVPMRLENGSCGLEYDLGLEMVMSAADNGDGLLLHQSLLHVTLPREATLLKACMEFNAYGAKLAGSVLGLDKDSGCIVLSRRLTVKWLDVDGLEQAVTTFMATASEVLAGLRSTGDAPVAGQSELPMNDDRILRV